MSRRNKASQFGAALRPQPPPIRRRKLVHVPKPPLINSNLNCKWVELFGEKVVTQVYAYEGGIALVCNERDPMTGYCYGLKACGDQAEWGLITDANELHKQASSGSGGEVEARYADLLPCTVSRLFDTTQVYSYFF